MDVADASERMPASQHSVSFSRRRFVGAAAGVVGAAASSWLWVPIMVHAQTAPRTTPPVAGATPTPAPRRVARAAPGAAAVGLFLDITRPARGVSGPIVVTGGSEDATHSRSIELLSAELGLDREATIGSAAGGAELGKAEFQALKITKRVDLASVGLFAAAAEGASFPQAELYVRRGPDSSEVVYDFRLLLVQSIVTTGDSESPIETVEFAFGAMGLSAAARRSPDTRDVLTSANWSQVINQPVLDVTP
jgi:type VI protein secretion system component Hcp